MQNSPQWTLVSRTQRFKRGAIAASAAGLTLTVAPPSFGDVGAEGDLALGVERVFGVLKSSGEREGADFGGTAFNLFYSPGGERTVHYSRPRVALDYFVADQLSLGASAGFYTWSDSESDTEESGWLLSPRVGYFVNLNQRFGLWPRGGVTLVRDQREPGNGPEVSSTASALTLELPLLVMLANNIGLDIGLNLDLGLGGEVETDPGASVDQTVTEIGVQFGLTGFF